ncbi:hypothetical protein GCM10009689_29100 [Brevibacterium antiquum]|uniref:glycosyltransferase n=1 Tax=Brevibacterium antiquum TaxID=234835 RepID=UPI0018E04896|nr:glycosyltransferase [Brevibacterium antiquum]
MKVLLAPSNVANQSTSIATGLRGLGHDVQIWNYGPSPNGFLVDREFNPETPSDYYNILEASLHEDFDVYHFQTARSLIPDRGGLPQMWDLPLLRSLGKKIVTSFHGSDIRRASHHVAEDPWSFYRFADIPCDEEKIDTRLAIIRTYANHMTVSSVLDAVYAPDAAYIPKSLNLNDYAMSALPNPSRPVVLHATRRRATKGTDIIEAGLEELQRKFNFEIKVVEGACHADLIHEIKSADIVVEKLLGGDAGVLSLEAMALGRVAVARIRDEVLNQHPTMPIASADPKTFQGTMAKLLTSPQLRQELADAGRVYVETTHSANSAAQKLQEMYRSPCKRVSRPHPDWGSDPSPRKLESAYARIRNLEEKLARNNTSLRKRR